MRTMPAMLLAVGLAAAQAPSKEDALAAMRKAAEFYWKKVSTEGGYHYDYAADLSYGKSEHSEGPTMVETQREATPVVAMAYLDAFDLTGDRFYLDAARAAAQALVRGQLCSGGWDYSIEFDAEKRKRYPYKADGRCAAEGLTGTTTLDDNVSQACIRVLMRVDRALEFKDRPIHETALAALDTLMAVQYPIGAWPQRFERRADFTNFPVVERASYPESWAWKWPGADYRMHYTFNDNSISDAIDVMLEATRIYDNNKYLESAERGGEFMLRAQMPDPQPAWAQQYDAQLRPAWARLFEPPSVTGGESIGVMRTLMVLYRETGKRKYLEPIGRAVAYLKNSTVPRTDAEVFRRIPASEPVLARFYELKTNKPLYVTKGTQINATGLGSKRPDGYELSYRPDSVITHYGVLVSGRELAPLERDFEALSKADPQTIKRPAKLRGLSPWAERGGPLQVPADRARTLISSMDERGAWTRLGSIGKADRVTSVFAARDMVLYIRHGQRGKTEAIPLSEDDTVEIFMGREKPLERIVNSAEFARNLTALAEYAAAKGR